MAENKNTQQIETASNCICLLIHFFFLFSLFLLAFVSAHDFMLIAIELQSVCAGQAKKKKQQNEKEKKFKSIERTSVSISYRKYNHNITHFLRAIER